MRRAGVLAAALALAAGPAAAMPEALPLDGVRTVGGVEVACTGIGQSRNDPRWLAYPLRVEFADSKREFLANGVLSVSDAQGREVVSVTCDGPWILLKVRPGTYRLDGWLPSSPDTAHQKATVSAPARGQTRFVLQFPQL